MVILCSGRSPGRLDWLVSCRKPMYGVERNSSACVAGAPRLLSATSLCITEYVEYAWLLALLRMDRRPWWSCADPWDAGVSTVQ